jgi:hypothetical protein
MKRIAIAFAFLLLAVGISPAQTDNTVYVKNFPGSDVGAKVAAAQQTCTTQAGIICILVLDPSLAAWPAGTMPTMNANVALTDYRYSGPAAMPGVSSDGSNGINVMGNAASLSVNLQLNAAKYPSLQAALTAAGTLGNDVRIPPGNYTLTDQLSVPAGVNVYAYGATLTWTAFGTRAQWPSPCNTGSVCASTGNGIRMNSNTGWFGGTIVANNIPNPLGVSVPNGSSGTFYNQIIIGHFSQETTGCVSCATSNVIIKDVTTTLLSGGRNVGIEIEGLAYDIKLQNITDNHPSTTTVVPGFGGGDTAFNATWGADGTGVIYHPYHVILDNYVINGFNDATFNSMARGIDISGAYDVSLKDVSVFNEYIALTLYIGDPGDGSTYTHYNGLGEIMSRVVVDGFNAENFNFGIQLLGDANGSSNQERGTHHIRATLKNLHMKGASWSSTGTGTWLSNLAIYANQADRWKIEGKSDIFNVQNAVDVQNPASGSTYTAYMGLDISGLEAHQTGRNAIYIGTAIMAQVHNNNIYDCGLDTGASASNRACIQSAGQGNAIAQNVIGRAGDTTSQYGVLTGAADATKATGGQNLVTGNYFLSAVISAMDGSQFVLDESNQLATGITLSTASPIPYLGRTANTLCLNNTGHCTNQSSNVTQNRTVTWSDTGGTPGVFPAAATVNQAVCVKNSTTLTLGYCSTTPTNGTCTCN